MTTVNEVISTGTDDAYGRSSDGTTYFSGASNVTQVIIGYTTYWYYGGFRFQTIDIAQGTVVDSATLDVHCTVDSGGPDTTLYGDDQDDAPTWDITAGGSPDRPFSPDLTLTTASVDPDPAGTGLYSIGISSICDEIFARGGWAANQDMRFLGETNVSSGNRYFIIASLEDATNPEPSLEIIYTAAGGGITNTNLVGSAGRMAGNGGGLAG